VRQANLLDTTAVPIERQESVQPLNMSWVLQLVSVIAMVAAIAAGGLLSYNMLIKDKKAKEHQPQRDEN
jgi:hypothetical protein